MGSIGTSTVYLGSRSSVSANLLAGCSTIAIKVWRRSYLGVAADPGGVRLVRGGSDDVMERCRASQDSAQAVDQDPERVLKPGACEKFGVSGLLVGRELFALADDGVVVRVLQQHGLGSESDVQGLQSDTGALGDVTDRARLVAAFGEHSWVAQTIRNRVCPARSARVDRLVLT